MSVQKKTDEWKDNHLLFGIRQIPSDEQYPYKPFRWLAALWLGVFIFGLGLISLISEYRLDISPEIKACGWFVLSIGGLTGVYIGIKKHRQLLRESALFFTFLMIGIGLGLLAQIFDFPFSGELLLLWASFSFILVLFSERSLLPLLWFPLFIGGLLGYLRLEFLLLFLNQAPAITVTLLAFLSGIFIYLTGSSCWPLIRSVHIWAVILFFGALLIGEGSISNHLLSAFITISCLSILAFYSATHQKTDLFNLALLFLIVRLIVLICDLLRMDTITDEGLTLIGLLILAAVGGRLIINQRANKQ